MKWNLNIKIVNKNIKGLCVNNIAKTQSSFFEKTMVAMKLPPVEDDGEEEEEEEWTICNWFSEGREKKNLEFLWIK